MDPQPGHDFDAFNLKTAIDVILDSTVGGLLELPEYLGITMEDTTSIDQNNITYRIRQDNNEFNFEFEANDEESAIKGSLISCVIKNPSMCNKIINFALNYPLYETSDERTLE